MKLYCVKHIEQTSRPSTTCHHCRRREDMWSLRWTCCMQEPKKEGGTPLVACLVFYRTSRTSSSKSRGYQRQLNFILAATFFLSKISLWAQFYRDGLGLDKVTARIGTQTGNPFGHRGWQSHHRTHCTYNYKDLKAGLPITLEEKLSFLKVR